MAISSLWHFYYLKVFTYRQSTLIKVLVYVKRQNKTIRRYKTMLKIDSLTKRAHMSNQYKKYIDMLALYTYICIHM